MDNILVPLDGSAYAECVLPHAIALAKVFDASVTLVHILDQPSASLRLPNADPIDWYLKKLAAAQYLEIVKARLEENGLRVKTLLLEGRVTEQIVTLAHMSQPDLLLLSGYGETGKHGGFVSSVTQQILQYIQISTLIVREDLSAGLPADGIHYQRVLVPLDGSQRAGVALSIAESIAGAHQAELSIVHVVAQPEMARHMPLKQEEAELVDRFVEINQKEGSKYLKLIASRLPIIVQTSILVSNNIAVTLQKYMEQAQIDLLIMSAHGYSGEAKWPYGSVTDRFITNSTVPLLIVQDQSQQSSESVPTNVDTRQPARQRVTGRSHLLSKTGKVRN
jgi:nucleotide-binding universal stress UspA family protein